MTGVTRSLEVAETSQRWRLTRKKSTAATAYSGTKTEPIRNRKDCY